MTSENFNTVEVEWPNRIQAFGCWWCIWTHLRTTQKIYPGTSTRCLPLDSLDAAAKDDWGSSPFRGWKSLGNVMGSRHPQKRRFSQKSCKKKNWIPKIQKPKFRKFLLCLKTCEVSGFKISRKKLRVCLRVQNPRFWYGFLFKEIGSFWVKTQRRNFLPPQPTDQPTLTEDNIFAPASDANVQILGGETGSSRSVQEVGGFKTEARVTFPPIPPQKRTCFNCHYVNSKPHVSRKRWLL